MAVTGIAMRRIVEDVKSMIHSAQIRSRSKKIVTIMFTIEEELGWKCHLSSIMLFSHLDFLDRRTDSLTVRECHINVIVTSKTMIYYSLQINMVVYYRVCDFLCSFLQCIINQRREIIYIEYISTY